MDKRNEYFMRTTTLGNKGEEMIKGILKWAGYTIVQSTSENSDWDCKAEKKGIVETFEGKTQDRCAEFGGFSVEVGNKTLGNYVNKVNNPDFIWDGYKCTFTGLSVSKADYQVFTDGSYVAFFVPTASMIDWFTNVKTHESHRIRWGGYKDRALQAQIRLEEINKIAESIVYNFSNKGKKSKIQLALEQRGLYINPNNKNK